MLERKKGRGGGLRSYNSLVVLRMMARTKFTWEPRVSVKVGESYMCVYMSAEGRGGGVVRAA